MGQWSDLELCVSETGGRAPLREKSPSYVNNLEREGEEDRGNERIPKRGEEKARDGMREKKGRRADRRENNQEAGEREAGHGVKRQATEARTGPGSSLR